MSWVMKANILDNRETVVYAESIEYMKLVNILYKWEVLK